jgi:predicted enzyme related to lactoylglutathione lyase
MFLGLRTVVYRVNDLEKAKAWYESASGVRPYFDQSYYVGFNVGGYELGLDPDVSAQASGSENSVAYWGVEHIKPSLERLLELGATLQTDVQDVGEGILMATVRDPFGNLVGLIENPHFSPGGQEGGDS